MFLVKFSQVKWSLELRERTTREEVISKVIHSSLLEQYYVLRIKHRGKQETQLRNKLAEFNLGAVRISECNMRKMEISGLGCWGLWLPVTHLNAFFNAISSLLLSGFVDASYVVPTHSALLHSVGFGFLPVTSRLPLYHFIYVLARNMHLPGYQEVALLVGATGPFHLNFYVNCFVNTSCHAIFNCV